MRGDPSELIAGTLTRWSDLDTDWQGVLVGAAIVALVGLFGVDIPW
ncbi:MAG: hypothetical protein RI560_07070 [Natronomonas sp.]|jgi:hypothetical protein|nr:MULTISPECIES: hypothetical protein [Natronomonas]MDR9381416.1 hypothetical protein [Natronomonas sp.]MDR9431366.1 hypothetical protein [Natronomonas sp.]